MKWLKAHTLISIAITIPLVLVLLYNTPFFRDYSQKLIGEKLASLALESSAHISSITYKQIRFSIISSQLTLDQPAVIFQSQLKDSLLNSFSAQSLTLKVDGLWKVYFKKSLVIEGLLISKPNVDIHKKSNNVQSTTLSLQAGDLYHSISNILQTFAISSFQLNNGHFDFHIHGEDGTSNITINDLSLWIDNFELNNESKDRKDKIFYTDNIKVKLANQSVNLPDSIHSVHFDSLLLSTIDDHFIVHGFRIQAKKDEAKKANYYDLHIPTINITNVDFNKAYNQHILEIEKIHLIGGNIEVDNEKTKIENRTPDLLIQLNQVFGRLAIQEFSLEDTQLIINAYPIGFQEKFNLHQLNLSVYEILLDHTNTSLDFNNRYFKHLELTLKNHSISLAERNHQLEIEGLHISTKQSLFSAEKVRLLPIVYDTNISALKEGQIYDLRLEGFDPYQFINNRQLLLKLIRVAALDLKITPQPNQALAQQTTLPNVEDLYPYIEPYLDKLQIDSLSIQNINLDFTTKNGPVVVTGASLLVESFDLDQTSHLLPENLLHTKNFVLFAPAATVPIENQLIKIDSLYLNKTKSVIATKSVRISNHSNATTKATEGQVDQLYFKGVKLRNILFNQEYIFDTLLINRPHIKIFTTGDGFKQNSRLEISKFISALEIGMLSITDGEFSFQESNLEISNLKNFNLQLVKVALSVPDLQQNNIQVKYDDFSLKFDSLYYSTPEFKHVLRVQSCQLHLKDSTGFIQHISLAPIVDTDSAALFTIDIPSITFKGINEYSSYFNKKIDVSSLQIYKPSIQVKAGSIKQKGFPTLKSHMFLLGWDSLGVSEFQIENGSFILQKEHERLTIKNFNMEVDDFNAQANVEMEPDRFLFSNEVRVGLSSINFINTEQYDTIIISSALLNSKNNTLQLKGIHFSFGQANPTNGSIPSIDLTEFSFYDFTQEKRINVNGLTIVRPELRISLPTKLEVTNTSKFGRLNTFPFDTKKIASVNIKSSIVKDAKLLGLSDSLLSVGNIGFSLTNFILHPDSIAKRNVPFHSEKFELSVSNLDYQINSMNKIHIGLLDYNSNPSTLTVNSFSMIPLYDKLAYGEKKGEQVSWLSLANSKMKINNLDFEQLIGNKAIHATSVIIDDVAIDIFRDKRLPFPADQVRELPQRNLLDLPFGVKIDSLHLKTGRIEYIEQSAKTDATGRIFFDKMRASITNITNDSLQITKKPTMTTTVETNLYGAAATVARFDFNLAAPDYGYKYSTTIGAFDLIKLNEILEPAILTKIREGKLHSLQQVVTANDNYAQGEMIFRYDNLKVGLIKDIDAPNPGLGKALASFFANTFIVRSRNPAPFVRKSDVFYERNHAKSIFDFLVKSTLSGVVESIGARSNRKKIKQHKKDEKQLAKRKNKVLPSDSQ